MSSKPALVVRLAPLLILLVGAIGALAGMQYLRGHNHRLAHERFRATAERAVAQLQTRMQTYEYGLRGARGAVIGAGGETISRERFRRYAASRDLRREFPGALGYGFVRRVLVADEAAFLEAARRDGAPGFEIRSLGPHRGDRLVIQYIEPGGDNAGAIGLDIASEPHRYAAAVRAAATGEPTMTAPVALVQLRLAPTGFLMLLPVYRDDASPPAPDQRAAAVIGWIYAPLAVAHVLADFDDRGGELTIAVADVTVPDHPVDVFATPGRDAASDPPLLEAHRLDLYGRTWRVEVRATPRFVSRLDLRSPSVLAALLLALTTLLAGLVYTVQWNRRRRHRLVVAGEQRFRDLAESIPHLVWTCRSDGTCDYLSPQWAVYTGIAEADQLGYAWLSQVHPDDVDEVRARWASAASSGGVFDVGFRIRRHDGTYRWFQTRATPVRDGAGAITKWYGSNTDVQELRDAQTVSANLNQRLEARVRERTDELEAANAALANLAGQLEAAQRLTSVGSWELNLADGTVAWSDELYRIVGLDPQEPAPSLAAQERLYSSESWAQLTRAFTHSLATGAGYELALEIQRPDGDRRVAVARAETVPDGRGGVAKLVGTLQDVTELARVRTTMETLTERMQVATSAAKLGVWDWNVVDNDLVWDDMMYALYDIHPGAFSGVYEGWSARIHPADRAATEAELEAAVAGTATYQPLFRIVRPDGEVRYLRAAALVHRDPVTNAALRVIGVNWDVTEQRLAELALRRNEALQRSILAHAGLAIIATDRSGTITSFNRAAEALVGYEASELVGIASPAIFHDPDELMDRGATLEQDLGITIESPFEVFVAEARQGRTETNEWTYVRKDGARVPVLLTVSAIRDDGGELLGFLGIAVDVSVRKQHERVLIELNRLLADRSDQAESASQAKSMFLANMSHEIRTPMNAITGVTHLLSRTPMSVDQQGLVQILSSATRTLLGMINDVLDLSKIEAQQLTLDLVPFKLAQVTQDIGGMMTALASDKQLELVVEIGDEVPGYLVGDPVRLTQILTNLVGNAIKFTDAGTVRLGVCIAPANPKDGDDSRVWLRFEVHDTGAGIDPALLPRLFTPFTQGESSEVRRSGGTGLGLAIVKQLAELMGGEVGVETAVGRGSEFWCVIPFDELALSARARWSADLALLIVDDRDGQRQALAASARRFGWRVVETSTVSDAAALLADQRPYRFDAVLMTDAPAGHQDRVALRELRAAAGASVPVFIVTTSPDAATVPPGLVPEGADAVLGRPITASALFDAVTASVDARSGRTGKISLGHLPGEALLRLDGARILVADDSKLNQIVLARMLELEGAQVACVGDGHEACLRIEAEPTAWDAILIDVQMPILDGIEATRRIRASLAASTLPIIAVTAGAMEHDRQRARAAGVDEIVSKPFDPEVVVWSVRTLIERARGRALPAPARRPATVSAAWSHIDGIDIADVRRRLGGDGALFRSLLHQLIAELGGMAWALPMAPDGAESAQLMARLHRLRGAASNLGARDLQQASAAAEEALREERSAEAEVHLRAVEAQLARLRDAIHTEPQPEAPSVTPATTSGPALDAAALGAFTRCLRNQDLQALALFPPLSAALAHALGAAAHARIGDRLDYLDFAAALALVDHLDEARQPS